MVDWLNLVLSRIADGTLLPAAYYSQLNCDDALDARDEKNFDTAWVEQSAAVERQWAAAEIEPEARRLAEDIRRESFLAVSRATGQHEIASYVSDDFELIVHGHLVDITDGLLGKLWAAYERGQFPHPPL